VTASWRREKKHAAEKTDKSGDPLIFKFSSSRVPRRENMREVKVKRRGRLTQDSAQKLREVKTLGEDQNDDERAGVKTCCLRHL